MQACDLVRNIQRIIDRYGDVEVLIDTPDGPREIQPWSTGDFAQYNDYDGELDSLATLLL